LACDSSGFFSVITEKQSILRIEKVFVKSI